jgi:hypothetical protein
MVSRNTLPFPSGAKQETLMKAVTIRCDHTSEELCLEVSEENICYIQCQLIQIHLSLEQTKLVRDHCNCMEPQMWFGQEGEGYITIDPSQLDLKGKHVVIQPVG